jgi:germinal-center associated nuclear protein
MHPLSQLGNGGEVAKFLQQQSADILATPEVQFAIKVWRALKTENYARFFSLLRSGTYLQACLMHRYVGEVRMTAIRKMVRVFKGGGGGGGEAYFPVSDLQRALMFEDEDDVMGFLQHIGLPVSKNSGRA